MKFSDLLISIKIAWAEELKCFDMVIHSITYI